MIFPSSSWSAFKVLAVAKQLGLQYAEYIDHYEIVISDGVIIWSIGLLRDGGADVTDFENNYKAISNRPSFFHGQFRNRYLNITGNDTEVVKSGSGVLRGISINNNNTGGEITIYDNTAASGTKIATIKVATPSGGLLSSSGLQGANFLSFTAEFTTGLTVVTSGSSDNDITVLYV